MTGRGSRMSPKERYLRSVYLNYQVCTDVVRHYFDGLHPPTSLVQYLLDQRTKFEKEEKKIPNYQWIQLYPEDLKDYKEFTDRISTIFTCLFDTVDGDQKVKVVNLSRLESGEVLATLEITSQYNPDDRIIQSALEEPVNSGNVDQSLETSTDEFTFAKQGGNIDFRIGSTQSVEVEEFRYLTLDCATAICKLTSEKHNDDKMLEEAISIPTSEGRLGKTLKTTCTHNGFSFKEVIVFEAEINVKEKFSKTLENSNSNDFKAFANRVQPIIKGLYNSETGEQDVEIIKCRQGSSDTVLVLYHLISHGNNDEEGLRAVTERKIRTGSLSLSYGITDDGFSFPETNKCMFEVTLRLAEKYSDSKELANPKSDAFKSLKEKVQPEILRLYDSVCGSQEIDILRYKIESSGAVHSIIFKLTSSGCSDESTLKEPVEKQIQTGLLGSSLKICATDLHFQKLTETVFYQVTLNVEKTFTDELKKKHSADYLAFSKFVQTVLRTQYEKVPGKQEFNVVECQQGPSGTNSTVVIIDVISKGCTNNVYMQLCQPVKTLLLLGNWSSKPVSSGCFDLSLLITLLRRDSNVKPPKNGYDVLPSKGDISDGAQIATIKHYRNELAHARDAKRDEHEFDSLWSNLENAVRILGKDDKFMKAVDDASTMKLDSSTEEALIRMVQQDRQILQLEEDVTELYQKLKSLPNKQKINLPVHKRKNMNSTTFTENLVTHLNQLDLSKQQELVCTKDIHNEDIALAGSCYMGTIDTCQMVDKRERPLDIHQTSQQQERTTIRHTTGENDHQTYNSRERPLDIQQERTTIRHTTVDHQTYNSRERPLDIQQERTTIRHTTGEKRPLDIQQENDHQTYNRRERPLDIQQIRRERPLYIQQRERPLDIQQERTTIRHTTGENDHQTYNRRERPSDIQQERTTIRHTTGEKRPLDIQQERTTIRHTTGEKRPSDIQQERTTIRHTTGENDHQTYNRRERPSDIQQERTTTLDIQQERTTIRHTTGENDHQTYNRRERPSDIQQERTTIRHTTGENDH
ncbi:unnamed protein product [Mytilus edulis]|uniref:SEA domain-containing protein n=1 Tax=Mytilus edulis TaxID=6550 RepID=A0A8S3R6E5_MYTED|nr:unnamed protein product [Mytilus edulis]